MGKHPFYLNIISSVLGVSYNKFYKWYKESLSDFKSEATQKSLHQYDIEAAASTEKKPQKISVPIVRKENIGSKMAIDEKHINGEFYTILTNGETGKVAMMAATINGTDIGNCLKHFGTQLNTVKTITRDLSTTFEKVANENFSEAVQVADKFHVIQQAIESVQEVRIRHKQAALLAQRKAQKEHSQLYQQYKKLPGECQEKIRKKYVSNRLANGETAAELLSRSNYLLYKMSGNWTAKQIQRAELLFATFPEIKTAYEAIENFRNWYDPKKNKCSIQQKEIQLWDWVYETETIKIDELLNFQNTVENNFEYVLNYYKKKATNAIAESTNAKIQQCIQQNRGTRDIDFFNFRLAMII